MKHMKKTICEKEYLEHMIPHHQVAVDMNIRVLKHTNNQTKPGPQMRDRTPSSGTSSELTSTENHTGVGP